MTQLYQKCPDCNGTRRLAKGKAVTTGGFFAAGVQCPCCEDGYVEISLTLQQVQQNAAQVAKLRNRLGEIAQFVTEALEDK